MQLKKFHVAKKETPTWRIIPVSKLLVTPIYKPFSPFGRGISLLRGLTNHGYNHLLTGMTLQARRARLNGNVSLGRDKPRDADEHWGGWWSLREQIAAYLWHCLMFFIHMTCGFATKSICCVCFKITLHKGVVVMVSFFVNLFLKDVESQGKTDSLQIVWQKSFDWLLCSLEVVVPVFTCDDVILDRSLEQQESPQNLIFFCGNMFGFYCSTLACGCFQK